MPDTFKVVIKSNLEMGDYIALHGLVPDNELDIGFRNRIPKNEIWIRQNIFDDKKKFKAILNHEVYELMLMTQTGVSYKDAHKKTEIEQKRCIERGGEWNKDVCAVWRD